MELTISVENFIARLSREEASAICDWAFRHSKAQAYTMVRDDDAIKLIIIPEGSDDPILEFELGPFLLKEYEDAAEYEEDAAKYVKALRETMDKIEELEAARVFGGQV